uniref:Uncharacterized protein n=1 Tax=Arundo donax TaxID=35708 RepID=A0A0A9GTX9_ARUDO
MSHYEANSSTPCTISCLDACPYYSFGSLYMSCLVTLSLLGLYFQYLLVSFFLSN